MGSLLDMNETKLLSLVREIALDIQEIPDILAQQGITWAQYEELQQTDRFKMLLEDAVVAWRSALNAQERLKLKAATILEDFVPELHGRLHDRGESLNHKIEGAKLLARIAGVDSTGGASGVAGEKFTVTINIGNKAPIKIVNEPPVEVIDMAAIIADPITPGSNSHG
jgi:hypothetical protein